MSEEELNEILLRARIDESVKMILSIYPDSHGFSKRYIIKTLELVDSYIQKHPMILPPKQSENVCAKCQGRGWVWCGVMNEDVTECDCTEEEDVRPLPSNPISADMPHPFGLSVRSDLNTFAESEHLSLPRKVKTE